MDSASKAAFATASRLLSCLVTESLVQAVYYKLEGSLDAAGFAVIYQPRVPDSAITLRYDSDEILAIVPLLHQPVFKHDGVDNEIGLLDPMDMMRLVLEPIPLTSSNLDQSYHELSNAIVSALKIDPSSTGLAASRSPIPLWNKFAKASNVKEELIQDIADELESSVKWQKYSYDNPPLAPTFDSDSIDWEQSIVEGHPTHPMHKTRMFLPPMVDVAPGSYDLYHPHLRLISVPRSNLNVTYDFERLTAPILDAVTAVAGNTLTIPDDHVVIPVHELQIPHITDKFSDAVVYPEDFRLPLLAQQSIRSVILPGVYTNLHLKLGVGIKLTSAVRTISPASAFLGPRFSAQVVPSLTMDRNILTVAKELASVVHTNPDSEVAKHCACLVREAHEIGSVERGERLIVCTSLVEGGHVGKDGHLPSVIRAFGLDTEDKRVAWLDEFVEIFFKAFLPSVLHNGVAFEAHPQNCVARFDLETHRILGFIIRDFGGLRIHPPTLLSSTGVSLSFLDGHSIIAPDLDDVYARMYHTVIHNHLQQLIRVLGLHYNGKGWEIVRRWFTEIVPQEHPLYEAWLGPERKTFPGKCFMRMRMQGMYRFHLHGPFPNLIHYRGVETTTG